MRCCVHILNLIVQDGLKQIDDSICKIYDSVKCVKGTKVGKETFLACVNMVSEGESQRK